MGLRGIFDPENGFFRTLSRMVDVVGLSLLWVALSLPLVTFGPACAALYHTVTHCVVRQGDSTYLTFFRSFRANLRVGIPAGLLVLAAGALLLQGYQIMVLAANSVGGGALAMYGCYCAALIVPGPRVLLGLPSAVPLPDGAGTPAGHLLSGDLRHLPQTPAPDPAPVRHGVGHGRLLPAGCLHPRSQRTARLHARGARHPPVSPREGA